MGITVTPSDAGYVASNLPGHAYDSRENASKAASQYSKTQTIREVGLIQKQAVQDRNRFGSMLERQAADQASSSASSTRPASAEGSDLKSYFMNRLASREKNRGWEIHHLPHTVDFVVEWAENLTAAKKRKDRNEGEPLGFDVRRDYALAALKYLQTALESGKDVSPASLKTRDFGWSVDGLGRTQSQRITRFRDYCLAEEEDEACVPGTSLPAGDMPALQLIHESFRHDTPVAPASAATSILQGPAEAPSPSVRTYVMERLASGTGRGAGIRDLTSTVGFVIEWAEHLSAITPGRGKEKGGLLSFKIRQESAMAVLGYLENAYKNGQDISPASLKTLGFDWSLDGVKPSYIQCVSRFRSYCVL